MLDQEDLKWIASVSTELNSIVQQVSRYADLARRHKGEHDYLDLLGERVEFASKTAQALFDRVTFKNSGRLIRQDEKKRTNEIYGRSVAVSNNAISSGPENNDWTGNRARKSGGPKWKRGARDSIDNPS